eukprot:CAMPEP_0168492030 /NCGR_PEP_ID=MMETSP0228-20121227/69999_1 /TAXON_ID=133427 /ORGANISM="Protoceratium reticulatum, Strain CCCM 535 (=CCMP 1889)" /LENGTH=30 /DNA_ID= /DNA_START= /DNA_END= /DNA_ORIENTATION=
MRRFILGNGPPRHLGRAALAGALAAVGRPL